MGKIKRTAARLIAHHIKMSLKHNRRSILIALAGRLADIKIMVRILLRLQSALHCPCKDMVAQGFFISADMRDMTELIKMSEYRRLEQCGLTVIHFFTSSRKTLYHIIVRKRRYGNDFLRSE